MEIKEMNSEQVEARLAEIRSLIDAEDADIEALTSEVDALIERRDSIKKSAAEKRALLEKVANSDIKPIAEIEERENNMEVRDSKAYIEAFANYCKTGDDAECRALLTENVTGGTVPVPTFVGEIVAKRFSESKILSRVRRMTAAGNVKVGFEISAPAAGKHTEGGAAIAEEALSLGIVELKPETFKKWVSVSDEALDSMSGQAYLEYIYDEVTRGIVKARENAVVAAILAAPQTATATQPAVAKTGSAAGAIDDLIQARALLSSAAENLVVIMTPAQYANYRSLQLSASYAVDPFDGLEVLFNDTATAPIIGDLAGVMENLPKGDSIEFKYDDKTDMKKDLVNVLGRQPSAIAVVGNKYFAKVAA